MSSYNEVIHDALDEIDEEDKTADISPQSIQRYILKACQLVTQRIKVKDQTDLRVIYGVAKYNFADSTVPVAGTGTIAASANLVTGDTATGTGTISTADNVVTGVGTSFISELSVGKMIIVGEEAKYVTEITSDTACEIDGQFDTDLSESAFDYSTTIFTKEVNVGSTIISNSVSKVVDSITDAYNLVVTTPYEADQTEEAFTIDTEVTEIPTKFYKITDCSRTEETVELPVGVVPHDKLIRQKQRDAGLGNYSNYSQPLILAQWQDGATRYIEIYPTVQTDKQITLFGFIKINPRDYVDNELTADIPLSEDFEPIIMEYVKHRVYKKIKDNKLANESLLLFENYIRQAISNIPATREVTVDYQ